jgi:hypothetical protein
MKTGLESKSSPKLRQRNKCVHKTKQNKTKQNKTKRNETKRNETKRNETKRNETKRNETKRNNYIYFYHVNLQGQGSYCAS